MVAKKHRNVHFGAKIGLRLEETLTVGVDLVIVFFSGAGDVPTSIYRTEPPLSAFGEGSRGRPPSPDLFNSPPFFSSYLMFCANICGSIVGLQPFHVFHTASVPSKPVKRAPGGVGARRKIDLSSPTLPSGVEGEEQVYYEQLRREAFEVVWSDLEASIKVVSLLGFVLMCFIVFIAVWHLCVVCVVYAGCSASDEC